MSNNGIPSSGSRWSDRVGRYAMDTWPRRRPRTSVPVSRWSTIVVVLNIQRVSEVVLWRDSAPVAGPYWAVSARQQAVVKRHGVVRRTGDSADQNRGEASSAVREPKRDIVGVAVDIDLRLERDRALGRAAEPRRARHRVEPAGRHALRHLRLRHPPGGALPADDIIERIAGHRRGHEARNDHQDSDEAHRPRSHGLAPWHPPLLPTSVRPYVLHGECRRSDTIYFTSRIGHWQKIPTL